MDVRIAAAKAALGDRLVILGHHYQRDEVIKFADYTGDSLKLAQYAAAPARTPTTSSSAASTSWPRAPTSSARPHQQVILPDLAAGCSMADMAAIDQLEVCWEELRDARRHRASFRSPTSTRPPPSKASAASTAASSARRATPRRSMAWAWERGEKLLMLPDQHLGRNTAFRMGVPLDEMVVWDPDLPFGGVDARRAPRARG